MVEDSDDEVGSVGMPDICDSDSSEDVDPEVFHGKYGFGWQDIRDKRRA